MRVSPIACFAVSVVVLAVSASGQTAPDTPEAAIRALVRAMYANDVAAYEKLTLPDPGRIRLVRGGSVNKEALAELDQNPEAVQIRLARPYQFKAREVRPDDKGNYPIGTTVRFSVAYRNPMIVTLVRRPEGWKIDVRWWLAMLDLASGPPPPRDSPDYAARALIASLVALDKKSALQFATPGASLDVLFTGAPSQREPSGQLEALIGEMPLIEIGPGEFCEMPSGRIVEGVRRDDMKVLVGLYGPVEMPFIVRRIGTAWKVEPEPYFMLILQ